MFINDIIKFIMLLKTVFILMNTWIVGKDMMKIIYMLKKYLKNLKGKT